MTSRAQLSQERSRQRREALLNAAIDLFAEGGSRAVTHRAVAAAAGLPAATTTYYFATIEDLLREALNHHIAQWIATMESLADIDVSGVMSLITDESAVTFAAGIFEGRPPTTASRELTVILGAARDPQLRDAAVTALTTGTDVLVGLLTRAGFTDAQGLAEDLVALIAGLALRRSAGVHTEAEEAVNAVRGVRTLIVGHLLGQEAGIELLAALRDRSLSGRSDESP
ncbi:TetR/AcrR family transcriptional regulator [Aeromicrobium duanguangcaii]|uniref:TetR family transcriptional regulator n=1 Tax=Aeromicrobium duanguangcaii TaxID=2968086 RepID=A0ABY5KC96_9ACTN|nr:TetR/AcrR family transcriptional regulator [Aeromicrobium duanguangcaii]MCD9155260.1 TetR family transcriptional regulator [Aeromicrobium duanguangcaii]MCL3838611.1 TetR family transcriptional regulator [Aeromicrobium duanguangcaii]UUI68089.1 TetR family transcriptional regulator [Aeromicrobium duanguangcaii]